MVFWHRFPVELRNRDFNLLNGNDFTDVWVILPPTDFFKCVIDDKKCGKWTSQHQEGKVYRDCLLCLWLWLCHVIGWCLWADCVSSVNVSWIEVFNYCYLIYDYIYTYILGQLYFFSMVVISVIVIRFRDGNCILHACSQWSVLHKD